MYKQINIIEVLGTKMLAVDKEIFDWGLEKEDIDKLKFICSKDPHLTESYVGNIKKHFISSFSEIIGQQVTLKEINDAIEKGEI